MDNETRYVVTLNVRVYAENDYMARKRAHQLKENVDDAWNNGEVKIEEIGCSPFASLQYRKLDNIDKPTAKLEDAPLPF